LAHGIALDDARREVQAEMGRGIGPKAHMPFTPSAKRTLELSLREAMRHGHKFITSGHISLAMIGEPEGRAVKVLVALGADLNDLHDALIELVDREGDAAAERSARARYVIRAATRSGSGVSQAEFAQLRAQRDALATGLRHYAQHEAGCPAETGKCSCGLGELLATIDDSAAHDKRDLGGQAQ
jgi:hypothetical protein